MAHFLRLAVLSAVLFLLPGCAGQSELTVPGAVPDNGCLLAAAKAQEYLPSALVSRILLIRSADGKAGHATLVYYLHRQGCWVVYDCIFGSRPLAQLRYGPPPAFPDPLELARAAFPAWPIGSAWYMEPAAR